MSKSNRRLTKMIFSLVLQKYCYTSKLLKKGPRKNFNKGLHFKDGQGTCIMYPIFSSCTPIKIEIPILFL